MPKKNGIEASKEILQIDYKIIIIFASADQSVREEALALGIKNFLIKPFLIEKLVETIQIALGEV